LLPLYPGLHTHRRALADGVRIHGCTVHYVTPEVDRGPIIAQGAVAVRDGDDEAALAARVLAVEHRLLPTAVGWHCAGRLVIANGAVRVSGGPREALGTAEIPCLPALQVQFEGLWIHRQRRDCGSYCERLLQRDRQTHQGLADDARQRPGGPGSLSTMTSPNQSRDRKGAFSARGGPY